jgi:hypothetical protein
MNCTVYVSFMLYHTKLRNFVVKINKQIFLTMHQKQNYSFVES